MKSIQGAFGKVAASVVMAGLLAATPLAAVAEEAAGTESQSSIISFIPPIVVVDQPVHLEPITTQPITDVSTINTVDYPDVIEGEWYVEGIHFCKIRGIMTGYSNGNFGVGDPLTRSQFITIIWRIAVPDDASSYIASSSTNTTALIDAVSGQYYTGAVNWAVSNGVVSGYDVNGVSTLGAENPITTEELAVMLARYSGNTSGADESVLDGFSDGDTVSGWARSSVAWACETGLIQGYGMPNGSREIRPHEQITRERAATIIKRAFDLGILS